VAKKLCVGSSEWYACSYVYHPSECETISGAEVFDLTEKQVKTNDDYSSKIICDVPSLSCYQGDCEMCPGTENIIKNIEQRFEDKI
jgi:hypothetical protein